jgi:hypothetical protein
MRPDAGAGSLRDMSFHAQVRAEGEGWRTVGVAMTRGEAAHLAAFEFARLSADEGLRVFQVRVTDASDVGPGGAVGDADPG